KYTLDDGIAAAKAVYGNQYNAVFTLKALSYFDNEELKHISENIKTELIRFVGGSKGLKVMEASGEIGDAEPLSS
ncbi:MAG: hypothetical protein KI790_11250, partial [Cyclobacteriaceae bacterium]|nr:hypothetical protein [Cyclobacteriaceae bacterium HetDA_MAG_MS6]